MENTKINKVLLEVFLPEEDKTTALGSAKSMMYNQVLPELDDVFQSVSADIRIHKIELDLGTVSRQTFNESLRISLLKYLNNYTTENGIAKNITSQGVQPAGSGFVRENDDPLLFFLQKGYWPWNMQQESAEDIMSFISEYFKEEANTARLFSLLPHQPDIVAERLIILVFSETRLNKPFIQSLQQFHPLFARLEPLMAKGYDKLILQKDFNYHLFFQLLKAKRLTAFPDVKDLFGSILSVTEGSLFNETRKRYWKGLMDNASDWDELKMLVEAIQSELKQPEINVEPDLPDNEMSLNEDDEVIETNKQYAGYDDNAVTHESFAGRGVDEDEKINITNAGMILFHLYLPYVFKELNWLSESNKFINAQAQQKAILFLQYLVTGKSRHMEHLLVLNKVLCGWPVHLPVMVKCNFSAKEKQAANDIMDSLKEHWPVLKNTSVQGLRESFINRNGILQRKQNGFLLQTERKTIDVLLDSLPFGISTIKLPWNEYIVHTEW